jgi:hypothetical protein
MCDFTKVNVGDSIKYRIEYTYRDEDHGGVVIPFSFSITNNDPARTVTNINLSICNNNGDCDIIDRNVMVQPDQTSYISDTFRMFASMASEDEPLSTTCNITYSDKSVEKCPEKDTKAGIPLYFDVTSSINGLDAEIDTEIDRCDVDSGGTCIALDVAQIISHWGDEGEGMPWDTNRDGVVDSQDFSIAVSWLGNATDFSTNN